MNEETVTLAIVKRLKQEGYQVHSVDFPPSGAGLRLKPNKRVRGNKGVVIPDIIASRNEICLIMENKDHFSPPDFEKLNTLFSSGEYSLALEQLSSELKTTLFLRAIGLPKEECDPEKATILLNLVDFLVGVEQDGSCLILRNINVGWEEL